MSGLPLVWGTTAAEVLRDYPADLLVAPPAVAMTRAVSVAAPANLSWRWLCQTALAPYSYDLVDNLGRRSPGELTPGLGEPEVGGRMVMVYDVTAVTPGEQWTGRTGPLAQRLAGTLGVTYAVHPEGPGSRLVCRMVVPGATRLQRTRAQALAWGDLVMIRKQLLTLKAYAERDALAAAD
ncbi:MAG: hypothetical protein LH468_06430 [Nocardioides sp.]|nr:hypothetical protein [Nocardioides sp.]